jgi:cyclohexadieny/prephenate dehydrogenase
MAEGDAARSSGRGPTGEVMALLGLGYMGGSLALAARRAGLVASVRGYDPDPAAGQVALDRGIVDQVLSTPGEAVAGAQLVVLAGPVQSLVPLARAIAGATSASALVVDIGSVKASVVAGIEATALAGRFVGCHPLAGTEASGPGAAHADLYLGKPCFICAGPATTAAALARAERLWVALGATVLAVDTAAHDDFMAAASHLPHVAAFALAGSLEDVSDMLVERIPPTYPPTSLRDSTRVAASNPAVWRDILLENQVPLLPLVRRLEGQLSAFRAALEERDSARLLQLLEQGRAVRRRIVR